jgi:2-phosphosulfolactate phosphatase
VRGVVVAVDVIRAFTTAAYAFGARAREIWLVAGIDEALSLGRAHPDAILLGEERGRRPVGFHLSNSPVDAATADLDGRVVIQRTSAGTQGAVAAVDADRLFAGSLVCASATAAAIAASGLGEPTYVITGQLPDRPQSGADDRMTAVFIEEVRTGREPDASKVAAEVLASDEAALTLALGGDDVRSDDIVFAVQVDRFPFAMEVERADAALRLLARVP